MKATQLENILKNSFSGLIGQRAAIENAKTDLRSFAMGGVIPCPLILGKAGTGKTEIMEAIRKAIAEIISAQNDGKVEGDKQILAIRDPETMRDRDSNSWKTFCATLAEVRPAFITIDEAQGFARGTEQIKAAYRFIKKATEHKDKRSTGIDEEKISSETVHVSRATLGFGLATNFPEKLPDVDAIRRRFDVYELSLYSDEETAAITSLMLAKLGVRADENSIKRIASCGRGTCEVPGKLSQKLASIARGEGKQTVNKDDILRAQRELGFYPRGLSASEVKLLGFQGTHSHTALVLRLGKERQSIAKSIAFLANMQSIEGKPLPLIIAKRGGVETTDAGKRYLADVKKLGFAVA